MTKRKKKLEPLPGDRCIAQIGDYSGLEIWQGQMHEFGPIDGSPMSDEDVTELRDELTAYLESRSENMTHGTPEQGEQLQATVRRSLDAVLTALAIRRTNAMTWAINAQCDASIATVRAYDDAIAIVKGEA